jgi:hypothetical protein
MINLPVDEAYAFDYLSILYVKNKQNKNNKTIQSIINFCENEIKKQIGQFLWDKIILSKEFNNMVLVNTEVFFAVEKARYETISAKEVDEYNMKRFLAKNELQKMFFPNKDITEWKS